MHLDEISFDEKHSMVVDLEKVMGSISLYYVLGERKGQNLILHRGEMASQPHTFGSMKDS